MVDWFFIIIYIEIIHEFQIEAKLNEMKFNFNFNRLVEFWNTNDEGKLTLRVKLSFLQKQKQKQKQ